MNSFAVFTFVACLAVTNAGWFHHEPSAKIIQGPSSKTTLVGPEGSVISAVAPGGQIVHEEHPGVIAHATPVVAHHVPVIAHDAPVVAHHVPTTVVAHDSSEHGHENAIIAGPSGTVARGHGVHGAVAAAHAAPVVAHHAAVVAPVVVPDDVHHYDHEGQYVHDHSESLYDDGSYKPHYYH
ncbi:cuticle protein LPCP-23-like [Anthonomus grandis grandis]|uniref:cuticle protein LPCP-23-like n=1 Tax=Anthonomus grandis grandis TaxID=2921223 RepID=UPI0021651621|nr:cuticle protein LPCP-23-like [Anthonomus grandis grandis]